APGRLSTAPTGSIVSFRHRHLPLKRAFGGSRSALRAKHEGRHTVPHNLAKFPSMPTSCLIAPVGGVSRGSTYGDRWRLNRAPARARSLVPPCTGGFRPSPPAAQ